MITLGRNEPCHCGSGKKYKKCHLEKDQEKEHKALEKAVIKPLGDQAEGEKRPAEKTFGKKDGAGWLNRMKNKVGFTRSSAPRKAPSSGG